MSEIDEALTRLERILSPRLGRGMARTVLQNLLKMKEMPGVPASAILQAIHSNIDAFARQPITRSPFSLPVSKAILEVAPRKLSFLRSRMNAGEPISGLSPVEIEALAAHADALATSFGDDPEHAVRVAYFCAFTYRHHLIFGEAWNRNRGEPVTLLDRAFQELPFDSQESDELWVPLSVLRGRGLILAFGPQASASLNERWRPLGLLYVPNAKGGRSLRLDQIPDLIEFFALIRPKITAESIAVLTQLMAVPFSPETTARFPDDTLAEELARAETEIEDRRAEVTGAERPSALLGIDRRPEPIELESLEVYFDPPGIWARYEPPRLSFG